MPALRCVKVRRQPGGGGRRWWLPSERQIRQTAFLRVTVGGKSYEGVFFPVVKVRDFCGFKDELRIWEAIEAVKLSGSEVTYTRLVPYTKRVFRSLSSLNVSF